MRPNYNKINRENCLGNGFEFLSASVVLAVCQGSSVFVNNTSIIEVNGMIVLPRMAGNI